jgi:hypothetical protein
MDEIQKKKRRPRGRSARGDFDQAKAVAMESLAQELAKKRERTERLKAQREGRSPNQVG